MLVKHHKFSFFPFFVGQIIFHIVLTYGVKIGAADGRDSCWQIEIEKLIVFEICLR
jgi:hypothetical protein